MVVQKFKRAGLLSDWPDYPSPAWSILQRMREINPQGTLTESPRPFLPSQPIPGEGMIDPNSARQKRTWPLNVVKKNSLDKVTSNNSPYLLLGVVTMVGRLVAGW
jgi:hypothetical protein